MTKLFAAGRNVALAVLLAAFALGGCSKQEESTSSNSSTSSTTATSGGQTTSSSSSTTTTTTTGSISLTLTRGGVTVNSVSSGQPATVSATLLDSSGSPVSDAVVTFSTDAAYGQLTPTAGTALTNSSGIASVTLSAASLTASGAAIITATGSVGSNTYTTSRGYSVGAANVSVTAPTFGVGAAPLSAFGNTSVAVTVTSGGTPLVNQLVTFSSSCSASGKAKLTSAALTDASGLATGSYTDLGCGTSDPVAAAVSGLATSSATLTVTSPATGSIQFLSATPSNITLSGTGGVGLQETSVIKFKVVDILNNPIGGKTVNFALNTAVGGITLTPTSAISDPVNGEVQTIVQAGVIATPVRVTATTLSGATTLTTQSDQLVLSTGIPDQNSVSMSATSFNIEGFNFDGSTTTLNVRLADHFNNPVPNGTAVYFTAEGGSIQPSCVTTDGACSVALTSQNPRPIDGRVNVLAYVLGEESFTDLNGNGRADTGEFTDIGEPYIDFNENGSHDAASETFINFDNVGTTRQGPDGLYSGLLCNTSCAASRSIYVYQQLPIVFSTNFAVVEVKHSGSGTFSGSVDLKGGCTNPGLVLNNIESFDVTVMDENGNPMPLGTTITATVTNGGLAGTGTSTVGNTPNPVLAFGGSLTQVDGTPKVSSAVTSLPAKRNALRVEVGNATVVSDSGCTDDKKTSGSLIITVRTPLGNTTTVSRDLIN